MGDRPEDWLHYRTEPVVVPLNVAELVENGDQHPGLVGVDEATASIDERYTNNTHEFEASDHELDAAIARYTDAYRSYGERFAAAVRDAAERMALTIQVTVEVDHDPQSDWWANPAISNPVLFENDDLVFQLWSEAHDAVSLPNVDVRLDRS